MTKCYFGADKSENKKTVQSFVFRQPYLESKTYNLLRNFEPTLLNWGDIIKNCKWKLLNLQVSYENLKKKINKK